GKHRYSPDVKRPGMLFGKVLRPATLGASLESVDLKAAEAMTGVTVVRDGAFVGVAAPSEQRAEHALAAIRAEWKSSSPPSDKHLFTDLKEGGGGGGGGGFGGWGNYTRGSLDKGLSAADHKVKATYTIAYIAHVPLEP